MRRTVLPVLAAVVATAALGAPAPARASCPETSCGVPACWSTSFKVRPDRARSFRIYCTHTTAATVLSQPAHGEISEVSVDYELRFTVRFAPDAPRTGEEAVLRLTGHGSTADVRLAFEVIPLAENQAPVCGDYEFAQRSDGSGPVDLFLHPYCRDDDGDEFTMYGGGPGVHPDSPKQVMAGDSDSNWRYRTATASGEETTTLWAIDSLGARSADAQLAVTVGPGVNRLPTCRPNPAYYLPSGVLPIRVRPGGTRRFAIICEDADADPFATTMSEPPARGAMTAFAPGEVHNGWWGSEQWFDATYVAADDSLEPDEFALTVDGSGGATTNRMAMVPRALPENGGGGCGWSPGTIEPGVPGEVFLMCDDDEGDPLSAEVVEAPAHGTTGPVAIVPALYGSSRIVIPYAPAEGFEGVDCVKVRISDGHGLDMTLTIDIYVRKQPVPAPFSVLPSGPVSVPLPPTPPLPGPPDPLLVRRFVEQTLGTNAVRRVLVSGTAEVWAPKRLSRRQLLRQRRAPGLMVLCPAGCTIRAKSRLLIGGRPRAVRSTNGSLLTAAPGSAGLIWMTVDHRDRTALARARRPRAGFTAGIRATGAKTRTATLRRSIDIRG